MNMNKKILENILVIIYVYNFQLIKLYILDKYIVCYQTNTSIVTFNQHWKLEHNSDLFILQTNTGKTIHACLYIYIL